MFNFFTITVFVTRNVGLPRDELKNANSFLKKPGRLSGAEQWGQHVSVSPMG